MSHLDNYSTRESVGEPRRRIVRSSYNGLTDRRINTHQNIEARDVSHETSAAPVIQANVEPGLRSYPGKRDTIRKLRSIRIDIKHTINALAKATL